MRPGWATPAGLPCRRIRRHFPPAHHCNQVETTVTAQTTNDVGPTVTASGNVGTFGLRKVPASLIPRCTGWPTRECKWREFVVHRIRITLDKPAIQRLSTAQIPLREKSPHLPHVLGPENIVLILLLFLDQTFWRSRAPR